MSQLFASGGQSIGASASTSVLPVNIQTDFLYTCLVGSPCSPRDSQQSSPTPILQFSAFFMVQLSHAYMTTGETIALTRWTFVDKVLSLLFNMLFWLVTAFLPRNKHLLISWLHSSSAVLLEPKKIKSVTVCFHCFPSICHEVMGPDAIKFVFWMFSFKSAFSLSSFIFIRRLFSLSLLSAIRVVSSAYLRLLYFSCQSWFQLVLHPAQHFSWCTLHIS